MILAIAAFELRKRRRMLSSWVYAFVLFAAGFLAMISAGGAFSSVSVGMGAHKVHANAPQALNGLITILSHLGVLVTASVFGQAVHQDREHGMDALFFTTPVRKVEYLAGRFLGAVIFSLSIFSVIGIGLWLGTVMPFVEPESFGPGRAAAYVWPYVTTVLPNIVISGAIFFALSILTRQMMPVYVASVVLVIGYLMAGSLLAKLETRTLAGMVDPFGMNAARLLTEYRSVAEQNAELVPLAGVLLANRVLWLSLSIGGLVLAARRFRFEHGTVTDRRPMVAATDGGSTPVVEGALVITPDTTHGLAGLLARMTWLGFRETIKDVYFGVIVFAGLLFVVIASFQAGSIFGTPTYPVTYTILEISGGTFGLFILIILTFYSGELVWRERDARMSLITDALPVPTWLPLFAKLFTLFLVQVFLLGVLLVGGILIQTAKGWFHYELGVYIKTLYGLRLYDYVLLCVLATTVHVIVNHKYVGHFVMVVYYLWTLFESKLGLEHNLYKFGESPQVQYSDMNGFGHFLRPVFWFNLYWAVFAVLLAILCHLLWPRGVEGGARFRLREARRRWTLGWRVATAAAVLAFAGLGAFIFYNTNVLNRYRTSHDVERLRAEYEKQYKHLEHVPQPRVTDVDVQLDVFPAEPALRAHGVYTLTNKSAEPIRTVYLNLATDLPIARLSLGEVAAPTRVDRDRGFFTFELPVPLAPNATIPLTFDLRFQERGFANDRASTEVVENGTFFHSSQLPTIGYVAGAELDDDGARKKYGLPPKPRMADLDDVPARQNSYLSHDADWVTFKATVSTTPDQIAIAPGYLERSWEEDGRRFSRFTMDQKVLHFFSVLSARYAVRRETWNGIALEIYYHPPHTYDLDRMMEGMRDALDYCSTSFGPYQHRQARILEFPRYATYAQAFPNTIPFSEAVGFVAKVDPEDPEDIDYPYYITAHEIAHQWWAHQVIGADVQGATVLSETLAQYSALMVMKKKLGPERMKRFLAYELDQYLKQRGFERKKEVPLFRVENQQYIHYQKGSLAMYALQDYAGEAKVNEALAGFLAQYRNAGPPYPTSRDLMAAFRRTLPPERHSLVEDLFETITFFDNRALSATARKLADGRYEVTVKASSRKVRADDLGAETDVRLDDLVDIGAVDTHGMVLFREKRRIASTDSEHTFTTASLPAKAGIDPLNILVDRKPADNLVRVEVP